MKKILHTPLTILFLAMLFFVSPSLHAQGANGFKLELKGASISEIYPNPAEQVAHFDYQLASSKQKARVEIFNLIGAVVWQQELLGMSGTLSVTLTNFKRGIYFYRLEVGGEKTAIRKLVVR